MIFKLLSAVCEPVWSNMLPGPSLEVSPFQPGSFKSSPLTPVYVRGRLECLKCHISPLSSDLLFSQKQASMLLADPLWMQVDVMWHISSSITVGSWVRKAGTGELVWETGGARAGLFLSRAAKIPPAPSNSGLIKLPPPWPEALNPPSAVMDKNKQTNQHTRLVRSSCTTGG